MVSLAKIKSCFGRHILLQTALVTAGRVGRISFSGSKLREIFIKHFTALHVLLLLICLAS